MKSIQFFALALLLGFTTACTPKSESTSEAETTAATVQEETAPSAGELYNISTKDAEAIWLGTKPEGLHFGSIALADGKLKFGDGLITEGKATLDLTKLSVLDEIPKDKKEQLVGHLTSEDFFNTATHPTIDVKINGSSAYSGGEVTPKADLPETISKFQVDAPTHTIKADLIIKGETHPIEFPAKVTQGEQGELIAQAFITFDRKKYGLRFLSDTDAAVDSEIHLGLSFSASKS